MQIIVNGDRREVSDGLTVAALLEVLQMRANRVAIERNREILPRAQWQATQVQANDSFEIVQFVGGGSDHPERDRSTKRMRAVIGLAVVWAIVLIWLLARGGRLLEASQEFSLHPWAIMAAFLTIIGLFWILLWTKARDAKMPRAFVLLKLASDVLILALAAGFLLLNWSSRVLIVLAFALAVTYAARFIRSAVGTIGRARKS